MKRKIIIRPEAAREVQDAFDWYEERDEGLGAEFLRAVEACLSAIRRNPCNCSAQSASKQTDEQKSLA